MLAYHWFAELFEFPKAAYKFPIIIILDDTQMKEKDDDDDGDTIEFYT